MAAKATAPAVVTQVVGSTLAGYKGLLKEAMDVIAQAKQTFHDMILGKSKQDGYVSVALPERKKDKTSTVTTTSTTYEVVSGGKGSKAASESASKLATRVKESVPAAHAASKAKIAEQVSKITVSTASGSSSSSRSAHTKSTVKAKVVKKINMHASTKSRE